MDISTPVQQAAVSVTPGPGLMTHGSRLTTRNLETRNPKPVVTQSFQSFLHAMASAPGRFVSFVFATYDEHPATAKLITTNWQL